eukprot:746211-Hanusia_phi.AAC.1
MGGRNIRKQEAEEEEVNGFRGYGGEIVAMELQRARGGGERRFVGQGGERGGGGMFGGRGERGVGDYQVRSRGRGGYEGRKRGSSSRQG